MFWKTVLYQMCLLQIFSPSLWFSFHSLDGVFPKQKFLISVKSRLSIILFMDRDFDVVAKKCHYQTPVI